MHLFVKVPGDEFFPLACRGAFLRLRGRVNDGECNVVFSGFLDDLWQP
ncbi:MAG: hypothetical protein OXH00_16845 [Candidatus Poribacteria bacterium]|nr:hypothetical protein [Candidatus Poribacteria bacterium]